MDPAIKQGFAIGLIIAAGAGLFGWSQGWWPTPEMMAKLDALSPGARQDQAAPPSAKTDRAAPEAAENQKDPSAAPGVIAPEAAAGSPQAPAAVTKAPVENGAFDVVRVEPTGESVVAGRCAAKCVVELTANGKVLDTATADESGNWAMTPPALIPGDYQLGLQIKGPDGKIVVSQQSVTVSVPETSRGEVVVVLNEPNAPSRVLQRPGQGPAVAKSPAGAGDAASTAAQAVATVSIGAVDAEKGRLFIQGAAPAGADLRVYLNNALIAQPVTGRDQSWSVRIERGLAPGDYVARVDHVEKSSGKVVARAEARFAYQGEVADGGTNGGAGRRSEPEATASIQAAAPQGNPAVVASSIGDKTTVGAVAAANATRERSDAGAADAANPVIASIDTANVKRGDSLWQISRKTYGAGRRYTVIFTANDKQIRNPSLIYPGQMLVLPEDPSKAASKG